MGQIDIDIDEHEKLELVSEEIKQLIHDEEIMEQIIEKTNQQLKKLKATKFEFKVALRFLKSVRKKFDQRIAPKSLYHCRFLDTSNHY